MGSLDNVWCLVPEAVETEELQQAFRAHFGADWSEVLSAAQMSLAYNAANNAYFAVRDLRPVEELTLEELLEREGIGSSPNIIAS